MSTTLTMNKFDMEISTAIESITVDLNNYTNIINSGIGNLNAAAVSIGQDNLEVSAEVVMPSIALEKVNWDKIKTNLKSLFSMVVRAIKKAFAWLTKQANNIFKLMLKYGLVIDKSTIKLEFKRKTMGNTIKMLNSMNKPMPFLEYMPGVRDRKEFINMLSQFVSNGKVNSLFTIKVLQKIYKDLDLSGFSLTKSKDGILKPEDIWDGESIGEVKVATYYQHVHDLGSELEDLTSKDSIDSDAVDRLVAMIESLEYQMNDFITYFTDKLNKSTDKIKPADIPTMVELTLYAYNNSYREVNKNVGLANEQLKDASGEDPLEHYASEIMDTLSRMDTDDTLIKIVFLKDPKLYSLYFRYLTLANRAGSGLPTNIQRLRIKQSKDVLNHYKAFLSIAHLSYDIVNGIIGEDKKILKLFK